jgi:hypothetical protein
MDFGRWALQDLPLLKMAVLGNETFLNLYNDRMLGREL